MREGTISNARYAVGDGNGGERGATRESRISNARYTIRDSDGGEGGASREGPFSNARYAVGVAAVSDGFGDSDFATVFIVVAVSYFYIVSIKVVVIDTIDVEIVCPKGRCDRKCHKKE